MFFYGNYRNHTFRRDDNAITKPLKYGIIVCIKDDNIKLSRVAIHFTAPFLSGFTSLYRRTQNKSGKNLQPAWKEATKIFSDKVFDEPAILPTMLCAIPFRRRN